MYVNIFKVFCFYEFQKQSLRVLENSRFGKIWILAGKYAWWRSFLSSWKLTERRAPAQNFPGTYSKFIDQFCYRARVHSFALTLAWIKLKNGQHTLIILRWEHAKCLSIFGHFSRLCTKELKKNSNTLLSAKKITGSDNILLQITLADLYYCRMEISYKSFSDLSKVSNIK